MITDAQVRALVTLRVHGGEMYPSGKTHVPATERVLRKATVDALIRAGLLTVSEVQTGRSSRHVAVNSEGDEVLRVHPDLLEAERIRVAVAHDHKVEYRMYSRGNSPIRGWGRTSMGCRVTCSCGWDVRDNSGRKSAETFNAWHLNEVVNDRLGAAGLPLDPDPEG